MIINKNTANIWTTDKDKLNYWITSSIQSAIYGAIASQTFNCDWHTPARYDATKDRRVVLACAESLRVLGYKVTVTEFEPNDKFPNLRIKLHINWE